MPIELGLTRITRLLSHLGNPHLAYKSVHIAGTNGKGSTLAYLSSILTKAKIRNGRFTSPHLLEYNDCISINNQTYPSTKFEEIREFVSLQNNSLQLGCTEFELLTATAFKIFELEKVEMALIEVGLGGRLDATNVLKPFTSDTSDYMGGVVATGITKIGLDHEKLLGSILKEIAKEKAGIIKMNIPVIVDETNHEEVRSVIKQKAQEEHAPLYFVKASSDPRIHKLVRMSPLKGSFQEQNLAVALKVLENLGQEIKEKLTEGIIEEGIQNTTWPGRLQTIKDPKTGIEALLDGAHNESAAIELGKYVEKMLNRDKGIIFVIALTEGKSIQNLLKHLSLGSADTVIPFHFTPPADMPWVKCYEEQKISDCATNFLSDVRQCKGSVHELFLNMKELRRGGDTRSIVICGSLYLCSDMLRYLRP